jgi:hypothetical protein
MVHHLRYEAVEIILEHGDFPKYTDAPAIEAECREFEDVLLDSLVIPILDYIKKKGCSISIKD